MRIAVAQWLRLKLSIPGSIPTIHELTAWKESGAFTNTNVLALCWCLVNSSRVY